MENASLARWERSQTLPAVQAEASDESTYQAPNVYDSLLHLNTSEDHARSKYSAWSKVLEHNCTKGQVLHSPGPAPSIAETKDWFKCLVN